MAEDVYPSVDALMKRFKRLRSKYRDVQGYREVVSRTEPVTSWSARITLGVSPDTVMNRGILMRYVESYEDACKYAETSRQLAGKRAKDREREEARGTLLRFVGGGFLLTVAFVVIASLSPVFNDKVMSARTGADMAIIAAFVGSLLTAAAFWPHEEEQPEESDTSQTLPEVSSL